MAITIRNSVLLLAVTVLCACVSGEQKQAASVSVHFSKPVANGEYDVASCDAAVADGVLTSRSTRSIDTSFCFTDSHGQRWGRIILEKEKARFCLWGNSAMAPCDAVAGCGSNFERLTNCRDLEVVQ